MKSVTLICAGLTDLIPSPRMTGLTLALDHQGPDEVPFLRVLPQVLEGLRDVWLWLPAEWGTEGKFLFLLLLPLLLGIPLGILRRLWRMGQQRLARWWLKRRSPFGRAHWARFKELRRAGLLPPQGLFLGHWRGSWRDGWRHCDLYQHGEGHLITIAGTGGGKSTGLVVPSLLTCREGSLIVTDPAGELTAITRRYRAALGPVVLLNPFYRDFEAETGLSFPDSGFNPLSILHPGANLKDDADGLARLLMVTDRHDAGSYWNREGAELIAALVMYLILYEPPARHRLTRLYEVLRGEETALVLAQMLACDEPVLRLAGEKYLAMIRDAPAQWQGAVSKAQDATNRYAPGFPLGVHTDLDGFDPARLKREDVTIYLMVPSGRIRVAEPWLNLLLGVFGLAVGQPGPARPVTVLMDEAAALGYLPDLQDFMRQFRKAGLRIWLFSQTLAGLRQIYGRDGLAEIVGLCATKQFFAIEELELARELSGFLGERTAFNPSLNEEREGLSTVGVPLIRPEQITGLKAGQQILVRGRLPPIRAWLAPYYTRSAWQAYTDPNPYRMRRTQ